MVLGLCVISFLFRVAILFWVWKVYIFCVIISLLRVAILAWDVILFFFRVAILAQERFKFL